MTQPQLVLCTEVADRLCLLWVKLFGQYFKIFFSRIFVIQVRQTKVVQPVLVHNWRIIFSHEQHRVLNETSGWVPGLEFIDPGQDFIRIVPHRPDFIEIAHEELGPLFVLAKENDLSNSSLAIHVRKVILKQWSSTDYDNDIVGIDFIKLILETADWTELLDAFEIGLEYFKVFAILIIVNSGIDPEKSHVISASVKLDFGELFENEELLVFLELVGSLGAWIAREVPVAGC